MSTDRELLAKAAEALREAAPPHSYAVQQNRRELLAEIYEHLNQANADEAAKEPK